MPVKAVILLYDVINSTTAAIPVLQIQILRSRSLVPDAGLALVLKALKLIKNKK